MLNIRGWYFIFLLLLIQRLYLSVLAIVSESSSIPIFPLSFCRAATFTFVIWPVQPWETFNTGSLCSPEKCVFLQRRALFFLNFLDILSYLSWLQRKKSTIHIQASCFYTGSQIQKWFKNPPNPPASLYQYCQSCSLSFLALCQGGCPNAHFASDRG